MRRLAPLLGRTDELGRVAEAIGDGDLSGVVLVGAAGVGKTRLAVESLAIAERVGFVTARVLATQAAASVPFGALAPLLSGVGADDIAGAGAFDAATRAIGALAAGQPFMLLVDDGHALDQASAMVLHQLVVTTNVFAVVTVRTGERCPDPVAALWKDELALRIDIGPLGREDTERYIAELVDGIVDAGTARAIWERSQGNPLYVRELVGGAVDAGHLRPDGGIWRLTSPLRPSARLEELLADRIDGLSPEQLAALELVVVGEPIALDILSAVVGEQAAVGLDRRRLIELATSEHRTEIRAAHPLLGDVIRERMPPLRRREASRQLLDAATTTGARPDEHGLRLAVWALDGGVPVDPASTLDAAHRARAAHDLALSARLARAAVDAGDRSVEAVQLLGEVLAAQGLHAEADALLVTAEADAVGDRQRALLAVTRADLLFWGLDAPDDALTVLTAAAAEITDEDWLDELTGQRATFELLAGRPLAALALAEPILARASGRPFVEAAMAAAPALALVGRCADAARVADAAFVEHVSLGEQEMLSNPGIHLVSRCLANGEAGRLVAAEDDARAAYAASVESAAPEGKAWFALLLGRVLWLRRPGQAEDWFRRADLAFSDLGQDGPRRWCLAGAACCAAMRGDADRAQAHAATEAELGGHAVQLMASDVRRCLAWVAWATGNGAEAGRLLLEAAALAADSGTAALEAAALHDRVRMGEADAVVDRLRDVAATVDGDLAASRAAHAAAAAAEDTNALVAVAERFADIGATVLAAEAAGHAVELHQRRGDRRAAERVAQRRQGWADEAGGVTTPAMALGGAASSLTRRELEIARLAATGRSNREIADGLVVSLRTVENHLHRVYEKLGIAGRDELVEALGADP